MAIATNNNPRSGRGVVMAEHGAVATAHPLATATGLKVLQDGGNFMDAAIATAAVLNVVEPYNSNLGGDVFMIVYEAATGTTYALNGSGKSPASVTLNVYSEGIPERGMAACTVPGQVDGWCTALKRWGSADLADLLGPAIGYAEKGFFVNFDLAHAINGGREVLAMFPTSKALFLKKGGPSPGERWSNPDFAETLKLLAGGGRDAFYAGPIAEAIVDFSQDNGGYLDADDLAAHSTIVTDPIKTTYRGYEICGQPPVSQGVILLEELNIVENFPFREWGHLSSDTLHYSIEAKKRAFADRFEYLGDPESVENPLDIMLSKEFAQGRARTIEASRAQSSAEAGPLNEHDTTYFCVMDSSGNAVSFIQSIFYGFGAGCVVGKTGMLMNNRMNGFYLHASSPNILAGGKRPIHTLNAYMVLAKGRPFLVCGTPGGDVQVQTNLQIIQNIIDFDMTVQEAIEAPRWEHNGAVVHMEDRIPHDAVNELKKRGHSVDVGSSWGGSGLVQGILVHPDSGAMMAGSDPRCDGCAMGW